MTTIRTIRNENIVSIAIGSSHPTSEREIAYFARSVRLAEVAIVDPVARDLYGVTTLVLDEQKLARIWVARSLGRGFDAALYLVAERVAAANAA